MAMLDQFGSFFGLTGSPDAMQDKDVSELVQRLQMAQALPEEVQNALPFSGMMIDSPQPTSAAAPKPKLSQPVDGPYPGTGSEARTVAGKTEDRLMQDPGARAGGTTNIAKLPGAVRGAQEYKAPDFSPSFGERMSNFGNALSGKPYVNYESQQRGQQAAYMALRKMGLDDETAKGAVLNPDMMKLVLASKLGKGARQHGLQPQWGIRKGADGQPLLGPDGKPQWVMMQTADDATVAESRLPPNVEAVPPADLAEAKREGSEIGKAKGGAKVNLPGVLTNAALMLKTIDAVIDDPDRGSVTGLFQGSGYLPNVSGGARRVQSLVDQLQGKIFLQAFDSLRGGGQITEAEGAQAKAAIARLGALNVDDADYLTALRDARDATIDLVNLARAKAGMEALDREVFTEEGLKAELARSLPQRGQSQPEADAPRTELKPPGGLKPGQAGIPMEAKLGKNEKGQTKYFAPDPNRPGKFIEYP